MLKANVGLSRKVSKDYNSTGYSINLDGEITASVSDPEAMIEQVKELFDLAEEALNLQIERSESTSAIASHDVETSLPPVTAGANGNGNGHAPKNGHRPETTLPAKNNGNGSHTKDEEPATNKQIQYLLSIAKRQRLSTNRRTEYCLA